MSLKPVLSRLVLAGLLAACAWAPAQPTAGPAPTPEPPTPTPEVFIPVPPEARAEVAAREALARQLGLEMADIALLEFAEAEWPDSCLGLALAGQVCQAGAVPGFRIVLQAASAAYEVRTDRLAETVLVAGRVDPSRAEPPAARRRAGDDPFIQLAHPPGSGGGAAAPNL
jgi:hypothetical protein